MPGTEKKMTNKTPKHFTQEINRIQKQGQKQYAHWNNELFMEICKGAARLCWHNIQHQQNKEKVFAGYMNLIREGIGGAYITQSLQEWQYNYMIKASRQQLNITWNSFLEYCLLKEIPLTLSQVPAAQQLELITKIWNLGENILQEAPWMGLYILSRAEELPALTKIEEFLIEIMAPLLQPPEKARWQPPYRVSILDGRDIQDNFLPGDMHQVAPSVVCVHDRRLADVYGGIFMNNAPKTLLYHNQCLGHAQTEECDINLTFEDSSVTIQSNQVELTRLGEHYSYLLCSGGQLLVSAVDSQRIWQVVAG
jgi:hypothetical protein